jgi:hypothetical protein
MSVVVGSGELTVSGKVNVPLPLRICVAAAVF